jgi:Tol biopolymer transport system component
MKKIILLIIVIIKILTISCKNLFYGIAEFSSMDEIYHICVLNSSTKQLYKIYSNGENLQPINLTGGCEYGGFIWLKDGTIILSKKSFIRNINGSFVFLLYKIKPFSVYPELISTPETIDPFYPWNNTYRGSYYSPTISKDGSLIIFNLSVPAGMGTYTEYLVVMDSFGGNERKIQPGNIIPSSTPIGEPSISPDGDTLVFSYAPGLNYEIHKLSIKDTLNTNANSIKLTDGRYPTLSPNGQKVLFSFLDGTGYLRLYTINIDGTGKRKLNIQLNGDLRGPSWSHDGEKISFYNSTLGYHGVYICNLDGTGLKQLISDPAYTYTSFRGKPR